MSAPDRLFGARAVIFGAASGIGEAIARIYSKHGARVLAVDDEDSDVVHRLKAVPGVNGFALSAGDADAATTAIAKAVRDFGGLDIVVNSFCLQPAEPYREEATVQSAISRRLERMHRHFEVALPHLRSSPSGRVISIGFVRSAFTREGDALFAHAEDALTVQTRALAASSGQHGITVNYIQPGAVMTASSRRIFEADKPFRDDCIQASAARRIGDPIDVAKVALFLASDDAAFVSGTGIRVDGGRSDR